MTKYELIQNDIADKIRRGIYRENERLPSEHELIKQWGVSRITVIKALTELSLSGYIYRVQGKVSFVAPFDSHLSPLEHRGGLKTAAEKMLIKAAVIMPSYNGPHGSKILNGIMDTLTFPEYFVSTFFCKSTESENNAIDHCIRNNYKGIILYPSDHEFYSKAILKMSMDRYPIVLIDRKFPGIDVPSVTADNLQGSKAAVDHLFKSGHKRIAFIAANGHREQVTNFRFEGYREMMAQNNLPIYDFCGLKGNPDKYTVLTDMIKKGEITAVLACNSYAASKLYGICIDEKIKIPQDLAVICFDNPTSDDTDRINFFTYIDQNSYEMGVSSAEILKEMIENASTPESKVITPKLVIKKSTVKE